MKSDLITHTKMHLNSHFNQISDVLFVQFFLNEQIRFVYSKYLCLWGQMNGKRGIKT